MTMLLNSYERDTNLIAAHHQPAIMLDLATSRDIDSRALLRGTRLVLDDILTGRKLISPDRFLTLLANCQKALNADDTSFLFGQRLFPGSYGAVSQVLTHSQTLHQALIHICHHHSLLSPLCTPRYFENNDHLFIYWLDSCGAGAQFTFLLEAYMTAVASMGNRMLDSKLPWRFNFTHAEPRYIEQYWVHLSDEVKFNQQLSMMSIPLDITHQVRLKTSPISLQLALQGSKSQLTDIGWEASFLDTLYDYFRENIQQNIQLETVANAFGMSPASLKRKLLKHNTHFQKQLDLARKHVALYLYQVKGYQHHEVADYLRFNDINNFRRAFKRWTGLPPGQLLQENCF
jgi:AraC-like DNA-binding protein